MMGRADIQLTISETGRDQPEALVLCIDQKSQVQALEHPQPILPSGFGY